MHVFLYASMTAALDAEALARLGGRPRWGVTPSDPMGTTMRRIDGAHGRRPDRDPHLRDLRAGMGPAPRRWPASPGSTGGSSRSGSRSSRARGWSTPGPATSASAATASR